MTLLRRVSRWPCRAAAMAVDAEPGGAADSAEIDDGQSEHRVVLDETALSRLRELDPSGQGGLLGRVFMAFESSMARLLPQLEAAGRSGDLAAVKLAAHTLKSSAATLGALTMARQCAEIEAMVRDGDTAELAPRIDALLRESVGVRLAAKAIAERRP